MFAKQVARQDRGGSSNLPPSANGGIMRKNLKLFRVEQDLTQTDMAAIMGCSVSLYSMVECGKRLGTQSFWSRMEDVFNLSENEIERLRIDK